MTDAAEPAISVVYVEDDERLGRATAQYLESHGVKVTILADGSSAVAEITRLRPDVVLLDLMLPGSDGFEVCRALRKQVEVPIVMVTARTDEADRVHGLEGGADDYVNKPFSPRELLARVRAHARRAKGKTVPRAERIVVGPLVVDPTNMTATLHGRPLTLTTLELALLRALAERAGRVVGREELLSLLHGSAEEAFDRSIDVHVSRLRQKIEEDPRAPRLLKTVRGAGYLLAAGEP